MELYVYVPMQSRDKQLRRPIGMILISHFYQSTQILLPVGM